MEQKVFPRPAVAGELARYVEARLHTDGRTNIDRILELKQELTGTEANPVYVLVEPKSNRPFGKFEGATFDENEFVEFLRTKALE